MHTRRQFLASGMRALAGVTIGMREQWRLIPTSAAARRLTPHVWLADASSAEQFRALALVAMEAAQRAGADFADIRIGVQREFFGYLGRIAVGYGVRARVDGTWSFQAGNLMTTDAVAGAARTAAADARTAAVINARLGQPAGLDLAPAPVVTGEWRSPVEIDPFAVPIDDYLHVRQSCSEVAKRFGAGAQSGCGMGWQVETRVFASTSGSLVTQELTRGGVWLSTMAGLPTPEHNVGLDIQGIGIRSIGFEAALDPTLFDRLAVGTEEAIRWRELPEQSFPDVGRYAVVFDGATMASVLGQTVNAALDGDRVAGLEADAAGRSFLTPVSEVLGAATPQFSPLLTITSGRASPSRVAVQWDDDGVVPETYTLVEQGHVVDYHTTRETAPLIAEGDARHGKPIHSHGNCLAPTPASIPVGFAGDVHVAPASGTASVDDLMREMGRGFLVIGGGMRASPGLTGGLMEAPLVVEVQQGKSTRRLPNMRFALATKGVTNKALVAVGDAGTLGTTMATANKGMPWEQIAFPVTAPAAFCKDVSVIHMDVSG